MAIWYIFPRFDILYQEKSGNPVGDRTRRDLFFIFVNFSTAEPQRPFSILSFDKHLTTRRVFFGHIGVPLWL
jgi:hypothetical protein